MKQDSQCLACGSKGMSVFFENTGVPVHSMVLLSSRDDALDFPRGDISLAYCEHCGFISNLAFDPEMVKYSPNYESSQAFSPRFNAFAEDLAGRLIQSYGLRGKRVLEIGCGRGDFLELICEMGDNRGVGIDPAAGDGAHNANGASRVEYVRELFAERHGAVDSDIVMCRHTLEHIWDVKSFLSTVRRAIGDRRIPVFFELPDVTRVLQDTAFWDVYYEHCSYFSANSLARFFRTMGFDEISVGTAFDDQYLLLNAFPANGSGHPDAGEPDYLESLRRTADDFAVRYESSIRSWKGRIDGYVGRGQRVIVWGGGSKGVAFLNMLGASDEIAYVVDINPLKQDKYVAGTGHKIVGPEFIPGHEPDVIVVMNAIYVDEIRGIVSNFGVEPEIVAV